MSRPTLHITPTELAAARAHVALLQSSGAEVPPDLQALADATPTSTIERVVTTKADQWGVLKADGSVEHSGVRPGGDMGIFNEDHARYIARGNGKVVRRIVTTTTTYGCWKED